MALVEHLAGRSKLPDYARMMSAYHQAFARELQEIVHTLPVRRGDRVVDFACGDGSYSRWLARRVGREGRVVALDISPAFLDLRNASRGAQRGRGRLTSFRLICGICRWPQTVSTWPGVRRACTVCPTQSMPCGGWAMSCGRGGTCPCSRTMSSITCYCRGRSNLSSRSRRPSCSHSWNSRIGHASSTSGGISAGHSAPRDW